jgi:hypothetical protein
MAYINPSVSRNISLSSARYVWLLRQCQADLVVGYIIIIIIIIIIRACYIPLKDVDVDLFCVKFMGHM